MSVAESATANELGEILTAGEAAAYLRVPEDALLKLAGEGAVPAQKIGEEWRFLKRALNDWLRYGNRRNGGPLSPDWLLESRFAEELLGILEQRLLHKLRVPPKPGAKEAAMRHFGVWKDDPTAEVLLEEIYARRGDE
ncbi:MAG TPA: DNA-binding protein [Gemmataceae bacterium]|nr:DNA-binding protein [Gemmataceae bacterium]